MVLGSGANARVVNLVAGEPEELAHVIVLAPCHGFEASVAIVAANGPAAMLGWFDLRPRG